jgi:hypothetical protein
VRMTIPDVEAARRFLAASGRVLDRRRFERLFLGGEARPVRDAVAAYRNPDGGFGHGLEPDERTPASQPLAVEAALRTLDEVDAWDEGLVRGACDWLEAAAPAEGGASFVEATMEGWPHGPYLVPEEGRPASLITTGLIAGTLLARGYRHPWLERATEVLWSRIDEMEAPDAYEVRGVLRFLQHVADRPRAEKALDRVARLLTEGGLVTPEPGAAGEVHTPLDFAPEPHSMARALFDKNLIDAHLDHLAASQQADGGWTFNWLAWSPAAALEWRGSVTVDALRVLRANGRW